MSTKGRELHQQALQANEAGEHLKALQLEDEAMIAYADDKDMLGFAEIHAMRSLTLRALADKNNEPAYYWSALGEMQVMVEMTRKNFDKSALAIPIFNLAKTYERVGELGKALESFTEAVELIQSNPPGGHANREAVISDIKMHLATCKYAFSGKAEDLKDAETAVEGLNQSKDQDKYSLDVWRSGGFMRMAQFLWDKGEKEKSAEDLLKAKEIVDANPDLKARREQLEKLSEKLK